MHRALLLLALLGFSLTGCIERRTALNLRYDEAGDVLHILYVHTHILGHNAEERDWLVKQWGWRERLIPTIRILGYQAFLRSSSNSSSNSFQEIDLDLPAKGEAIVRKTDVPLDLIEIKPGEHFVGPDGALAYTHQVSVPGKVIDAMLTIGNVGLNDDMAKQIAAERERRRNGGKVFRWDECRAALLETLEALGTGKPGPSYSEPDLPSPDRCLSEESLDKLATAAAERRLAFRRDHSRLLLDLPLAAVDRREIEEIFATAHKAALAKPKVKVLPKSVLELLESFTVKSRPDELLILSGQLPARLESPVLEDIQPLSAEQQRLHRETLAAIKKARIAVRTDVKIEDIVQQFFGDK